MTSAGTYVRKGFVDGAAAARGVERLGDAGPPRRARTHQAWSAVTEAFARASTRA